MKESMFNLYSLYYDIIYRDKDYASEAIYIRDLLTRYGVAKGNILEFGSGTGKHGRLLAKLGYNVHGIERSHEMVVKAETSTGFTCQQGDITTFKMGKFYDAVLPLFHVISYQIYNEQVQAVFANAAAHLNPGGIFIFDFWYSPAVYAKPPSVRVKRMKDEKIHITRVAEPEIHSEKNRVDVTYSIFAKDLITEKNWKNKEQDNVSLIHTFKETHSMRHFSLLEIDILSSIHGFKRVDAQQFLTGAKVSEETWSVCVILKKT
jgi:SAM-dependent methyltransferase